MYYSPDSIYLQDMASFKIATLQKTREESVPLSELEAANKQYQELTEKYRDLLERSNTMIAKNEHSATLEVLLSFYVTTMCLCVIYMSMVYLHVYGISTCLWCISTCLWYISTCISMVHASRWR